MSPLPLFSDFDSLNHCSQTVVVSPTGWWLLRCVPVAFSQVIEALKCCVCRMPRSAVTHFSIERHCADMSVYLYIDEGIIYFIYLTNLSESDFHI